MQTKTLSMRFRCGHFAAPGLVKVPFLDVSIWAKYIQAKTSTFQPSTWKKALYIVKALSAGFLDLVIDHLQQPKQKGKNILP